MSFHVSKIYWLQSPDMKLFVDVCQDFWKETFLLGFLGLYCFWRECAIRVLVKKKNCCLKVFLKPTNTVLSGRNMSRPLRSFCYLTDQHLASLRLLSQHHVVIYYCWIMHEDVMSIKTFNPLVFSQQPRSMRPWDNVPGLRGGFCKMSRLRSGAKTRKESQM